MKSSILVPVIVVLVVVAAVALVQVTGINIFQKPPEGGVVEVAISEILDTKMFKFNGNVEVDIKASVASTQGEDGSASLMGVSSVKMFVNVSSDVDQRKKNNLKTSSNINIGVDAGGMQMTGVIEAITSDSDLYVKLVAIPSVLTAFLGNIEDIKGQWIKIDFNDIKDQYNEVISQAGIEMNEEEVNEQLEDLIGEMKILLRGKTIFDITQELGTEEINEIQTDHYFVTANKETVKELIIEYTQLTKKYVSQDQKAEYDEKLKELMQGFSDGFDDVWERMGGISFDIWIEKRTGRLVRILWQKDIDPNSFSDVPEEIEAIGIKIDFSFSDFNKKVDIKAPSESKMLEEVLSDIMSTFAPQGLEMPVLPQGF